MNAPVYAAGTLILWEYVITVDDEIDLFWSSKLSWIKCLFFANRYLPIALRVWAIIYECFLPSPVCDRRKPYPSDHLCRLILSPDSVVCVTVQILVMEGILVLRLWAITGRRRFLLGFFCCLLFLSMAATLGVYFFHTTTAPVRLYNWLSMLIFKFIMFLTAVFYRVRGVKATKILTQVRQNFGLKPMMGMLLRDSVFYFLIVLCCIPILALEDKSAMGLSFMSITITRMLLRLRKRAKPDLDLTISQVMELATFRVAIPAEQVPINSDT
ncbi:hypothetical protein ARMGADRAFT_1168710 [Armillaria gallica]|uniref:DUF6533 domain-containing protein n=1 Tax=Armillaria gallica TaxID=47427 RepID=A0A2H3DDD2_ARMGA|nr:hypothetical protein ARMGADRAFT_1168710 [Armillaria gallica]